MKRRHTVLLTVARAGGSGVSTSYTYDGMSRLASFTHNAAGTANDLTVGFGYNPASQIVSRTVSNAAYKWAVAADLTTNYTSNSLNQIATLAGASFGHDARGNTDDDTVETYEFDADNRLIEAGTATQGYDPLGRLYNVAASSTVKFLYDGANVIAEYDGSNNLLRRYVHGPGVDEPVVWLEGTGSSNRTWLMADERGSVVAHGNASAAVSAINVYDPYGLPGSGNAGRFQYTGQMFMAETGLYHYKARTYAPATGRFLQPDPIGYAGGMNLYAYAGNDPVNFRDPWGLQAGALKDELVVHGTKKTWFSIESIKPAAWGISYSIVNLMLDDIRQGSLAPGGSAAGANKESEGEDQEEKNVCDVQYPNKTGGSPISPNEAVRDMRQDLSNDFGVIDRATQYYFPPYADPYSATYYANIGRAANRLAPGGKYDTLPGNYTYGAVTQEIGFANWLSLAFGDLFELAEATPFKQKNDDFPGLLDSPQAKREMKAGFKCRG